MVRLRLAGVVALAFLVQRVLFLGTGGTVPLLLLPLVCLVGGRHGPQKGTECGMFAGLLCWMVGVSPENLLLYPLFGGLGGKVFPKSGGSWGNWMRLLPLLAAGEGILLLVHGLAGWSVAWREGLVTWAWSPLAAALVRLTGTERGGCGWRDGIGWRLGRFWRCW